MIEPVSQPLRRIPVAMKPRLKEELARLRKIGVIKPVDTPTDWASSLLVVKKLNGKLRVCIDRKPFNKALKRSHYPLPVIDDLLPDLSKAKVFSVRDVKNGVWHVELDEASSYLTTFGTPFGCYRWLKLPFGISPASEYFQHRLDQAIEGLPGVRTVADDILITGEADTLQELFNNSFFFKLERSVTYPEARFIICDIKFYRNVIYAPNDDNPQFLRTCLTI